VKQMHGWTVIESFWHWRLAVSRVARFNGHERILLVEDDPRLAERFGVSSSGGLACRVRRWGRQRPLERLAEADYDDVAIE